ncbi:MAG: hypothetical protein JW742_05515 [Candidatus Aminicenantes bacterium]|nr:hypothetical protein [Candidatus Aminicenantes bacterium]
MTESLKPDAGRAMTRRSVALWEAAGAAFIVVAGSALHFVFEWSGGWRPIAWLAAVNESTWEHFKLGFWPGLLFAGVEYPFLKDRVGNFWAGKAAGLWTMPVLIGIVFYGYKAVLGRHFLWADIMLFVVAVAAGQAVSCRILTAPPLKPVWRRLAAAGLILLILAFALATYLPLDVFLFVDPRNGRTGIF